MAKRKGYTQRLKDEERLPDPKLVKAGKELEEVPEKLKGLKLSKDDPKTWGEGLKGLWDARNEKVREATKAEADAKERGPEAYKEYIMNQTADTVTNMGIPPTMGVTAWTKAGLPLGLGEKGTGGTIATRIPDVSKRKSQAVVANFKLNKMLEDNPDIPQGQNIQIRKIAAENPRAFSHIEDSTDFFEQDTPGEPIAWASYQPKDWDSKLGSINLAPEPNQRYDAAGSFVHEFNHGAQNVSLTPRKLYPRYERDPQKFEKGSKKAEKKRTLPEGLWQSEKDLHMPWLVLDKLKGLPSQFFPNPKKF